MMKPILPTLAKVFHALNQYKAQADKTDVPQDGVRPRRCGDAREEQDTDEPINNESPMVQLADYLFFNLSGVVNEPSKYFANLNDEVSAECPRVVDLFLKLQPAVGDGRYHLVAHNKLKLVSDWGCAPFRLLDAALEALESDLVAIGQPSIDMAHQVLKDRTVIFTNAAGAGGSAVALHGFEYARLSHMLSTAGAGNHNVQTQLGTEKQLAEDVVVIRRTLALAEEKLAKVRSLNREYSALSGDISVMAELDEMRAQKKRKV